ncbi:heme-binding protein [Pseudoxanthobacter sp.]|uniref:GlcG/HbpS family heme-binding protein n=1 Tax=Pseudoxanthobacter sp. TaxID=1925742 RepID=UPI002FE09587
MSAIAPGEAGLLQHRASLSGAAAAALAAAALDAAEKAGLGIAVAVTDAGGDVLCLRRADGVAAPIAAFALDKAYTAATMGKTTQAFGARMAAEPALAIALSGRQRLITWQGGVPVVAGGRIVGAIGVSGATGAEDEALARAALAALRLETTEPPAGAP